MARGQAGSQSYRYSLLIVAARAGEIDILAARVGRCYGDGYRWAMALRLPELLRLAALIPEIERRERVR